MSQTQKGASLLEVMVAVLVMSLGLLGMAGLQAATAKYRINIQANAVVAQLVSDFSERVRVNPNAAGPSYDSASGVGSSSYVLLSTWNAQAADKLSMTVDCETTVCTSSQRAEFDLVYWRRRVRNELPQGAAIVQGNRRDGIDITLMWMDKEQTSSEVDPETGKGNRSLQKAALCKADALGTIVHNCCPGIAAAPEGVRCLRMSFLP